MLYAAAALAVRLLWLRSNRATKSNASPLLSALAHELAWTLLCALPLATLLLLGAADLARLAPDPHALDAAQNSLDWRSALAAWFHTRLALHNVLWLVPLALFGRVTRRATMLGLAMAGAMIVSLRWSGGDGMSAHSLVAHALPSISLLLALVPVAVSELIGMLFFAQGMVAAVRAADHPAGHPLAQPAKLPGELEPAASLLVLGLRGVRAQSLALRVSASVLLLFAGLAAAGPLVSPRAPASTPAPAPTPSSTER